VQRYVERGELHLVENTPTFSYSAYAAYSMRADTDLVEWARAALVRAANALPDQWV
jgi:hypothetical protein